MAVRRRARRDGHRGDRSIDTFRVARATPPACRGAVRESTFLLLFYFFPYFMKPNYVHHSAIYIMLYICVYVDIFRHIDRDKNLISF